MAHHLRLIKGQSVNHAHLQLQDSVQPSIAVKEFKDALAEISYSVSIAAASSGEERNGRTITSVIPLSADPPRLLISIDTKSRMVDLITATKMFSVSILSSDRKRLPTLLRAGSMQRTAFRLAPGQNGHPDR